MAALPATTAGAAATPATVSIQVGANSTVGGVAFEGMRFLAPPTFTVHKGDTLSFNFKGLDTATLIPAGQGADEWAAENIENPAGKYAFIVPDSEDAGTFEFSSIDSFPSGPCGGASTPCDYDGTDVVNSGLPLGSSTFDVMVNAKPNDVFSVLSIVHPEMDMRVQVVDDATATTTQSAVDGYAASQLAKDRESAAALVPKLQHPTKHKAGGKTVWDAYAGYDRPGWGLDGMFPSTLHIKKGQTVRWHFDQLIGNVHTVTFPKKKAVGLNAVFPDLKCEADPTDTPPDAPPPAFCSSGPQNLELEVSSTSLFRQGSGKWGGTGFINSGVEGGGAPSVDPYDVKFTHRSSKKGFTYACIVHGAMMSGTVIVS